MNSLFTSVCCFCIVSDGINFENVIVQLPSRVLKVQQTLYSVQCMVYHLVYQMFSAFPT